MRVIILILILFVPNLASAQQPEITEPGLVRMVQQILNAYGLDAGPADGALRTQTRAALRRFEGAVGLPIDGRLDAETVLAVLRAASAIGKGGRGSSNTIEWEGKTFTLRDVERRCEVWRWSESWGDVECRSGDWEDEVEGECEVWFPNSGNVGEIDCDISEFRPIERFCTAVMYSDSYGDIEC